MDTLLFGLAFLFNTFLVDLFNGLDSGHYRWQQVMRLSIGLKEN